jgi:hypothetical protein
VGGGQGGIEGQGGREVSRSGAGGGGGYKWVRREGRVLVSRLRYSIYLLYQYKSTNTAAEAGTKVQILTQKLCSESSSGFRQRTVRRQRALLVQKCLLY